MGVIRRWGPYLVLALAIVSALSYTWQNRDIPGFGSLQDDAVYMLSAQSLSQGNGYKVAHLPGGPAQTKYPPLYPAALALVWAWQNNLSATLCAVGLIGAISSLVIGWLSCRLFLVFGFENGPALLLTALVVANGTSIHLSVFAMTELPYTAFLLATILVSELAAVRTWRWALTAGLLAGLAYLTRTAALPLAITIPALLLLRKRRLHALAFLAGLAPAVVSWQIWLSAHPANAPDWVLRFYTDYVGMERATVTWKNAGLILYTNFDTLLTGFGNLAIFLVGYSEVGHNAARLIAVAAVMGACRLSRRTGCWNYVAYALVYSAILSVWHYPPNERFTLPLMPLLLAGLWTEAARLIETVQASWRKPETSERVAAAGVATVLSAFAVFFVWSIVDARLVKLPTGASLDRSGTAQLRAAFAEVAHRTPANAVILSDQDGLLYLHTARRAYRTIVPPRLFYPMDTPAIQASFAEMPDAAGQPWTHALITRADWSHSLQPSGQSQLRATIGRRSDLTLIYQDEFSSLYRRNMSVAATLGAAAATALR